MTSLIAANVQWLPRQRMRRSLFHRRSTPGAVQQCGNHVRSNPVACRFGVRAAKYIPGELVRLDPISHLARKENSGDIVRLEHFFV